MVKVTDNQKNRIKRELETFFQRMEAQGFHLRFTSTLDMSDIKNRLFEIITMVSQFKKLTCTNSIDAQYIETVRDSINAIESKLTIFRSISLEEQQVLKKMEHELELELAAIQDHCTKQPVKSEKIQPIGHSIPQVIDFQNFVQKHGHEGGWDPTNHIAFVNLKKKYQGEQLYRQCEKRLLHVTMQEAAEHDVWYEQYLEHLNQKKIAIAKWKEEKRPEVVILEPVIELKRVDPVKEEERQRERELQKYAVMLWKVFRLNKAEKEKKRQEEEERIKAEEREKQERMRRAVKERLRNQHETPKPKTPSPEPIKKPIIVDKDLLKRQKERELKYFEKQIKLKQRQEEQERLKAQRLEKLKSTVRVVVERDPERLFQPTKGQLQKPQDKVAVGGLVRAQRRMIPDWRIGCQ